MKVRISKPRPRLKPVWYFYAYVVYRYAESGTHVTRRGSGAIKAAKPAHPGRFIAALESEIRRQGGFPSTEFVCVTAFNPI